MVSLPAKSLTLEEFLQQPETEPPSEFMEGEITQNRCHKQNIAVSN